MLVDMDHMIRWRPRGDFRLGQSFWFFNGGFGDRGLIDGRSLVRLRRNVSGVLLILVVQAVGEAQVANRGFLQRLFGRLRGTRLRSTSRFLALVATRAPLGGRLVGALGSATSLGRAGGRLLRLLGFLFPLRRYLLLRRLRLGLLLELGVLHLRVIVVVRHCPNRPCKRTRLEDRHGKRSLRRRPGVQPILNQTVSPGAANRVNQPAEGSKRVQQLGFRVQEMRARGIS